MGHRSNWKGFIVYVGTVKKYSKTPLVRINWDGEPSGYAGDPDN